MKLIPAFMIDPEVFALARNLQLKQLGTRFTQVGADTAQAKMTTSGIFSGNFKCPSVDILLTTSGIFLARESEKKRVVTQSKSQRHHTFKMPSWFAVSLYDDPDRCHMSWFPLDDPEQGGGPHGHRGGSRGPNRHDSSK
jgi:hypothetical protein